MNKWLCSALLFLLIPLANALEILRWERLPLAVPLQVGQERVVFIERNVRVGLPASLQGKLRVQSAGGALYLLASETIGPSGRVVLELPFTPLCSQDCLGLCPECGVNRNLDPDHGHGEKIDPRWDKLSELTGDTPN